MAKPNQPGFFHLEIVGAEELAAALRELGTDRLIRATLRRALLKAAAPIAADAKARAPRSRTRSAKRAGDPHLQDRIAVSATLSRRQRRGRRVLSDTEAEVYVGAAPRSPAIEAEFGTGPRRDKRGRFLGSMPAEPFMRPAWEAGKEKALKDFTDMLWVQIQKSAERLAKRTAKARAKP